MMKRISSEGGKEPGTGMDPNNNGIYIGKDTLQPTYYRRIQDCRKGKEMRTTLMTGLRAKKNLIGPDRPRVQ